MPKYEILQRTINDDEVTQRRSTANAMAVDNKLCAAVVHGVRTAAAVASGDMTVDDDRLQQHTSHVMTVIPLDHVQRMLFHVTTALKQFVAFTYYFSLV